ncbi:UvrD-helicase domain-containing protein [Subtercola vilae]|uniref:ATP-dependent helicase n=1 Tax=Subtercola vilae TaxID=2056433 RepID=A0A4T2BRR5_9MICO|nr:UvrD-helicase domain-containing protein [Subtercola vilae]TIH33880.1 ATP-dependent helicase [Subtercola vilae]
MPSDPSVDDKVDAEIAEYLTPEAARSFFLYAGAGSGKTRSLVLALQDATRKRGHDLTLRGQQIAVITFTNAAADEISSRLDFDPLITVSTIHSFAWRLVNEFQEDIRDWMKRELQASVASLQASPSKSGTKKEADRIDRLERDLERTATIDRIRRFTYNPAGENREREALNHSQVIKLTAHLLVSKPTLAHILVTRHPILFIDESQDTNKTLLEAFMHVAVEWEGRFVLGLFGDTMQRIYNEGKTDIETSIPTSWATPAKVMNHRSPERIVELGNRIRADVDDHAQQSREDRGTGTVRLFLAAASSDTVTVETVASEMMAEITGDTDWTISATDDVRTGKNPAVKRLILEHSMAAQRFGFAEIFAALRSVPGDNTSILDGSVPELQVFLNQVVPLIQAHQRGDKFTVARIVRENSPLMTRERLNQVSSEAGILRAILSECQAAVDQLTNLWSGNLVPTLGQVAGVLEATRLFPLPTSIKTALMAAQVEGEAEASTAGIESWQRCLNSSFSQVERYGRYFAGETPFATHQGVKGLEFPRVMVVISDEEAGGFMFSYEKLLGAKGLTATDISNAAKGKDSSLSRTRRLMYVTASRASEALAIVAYTSDPQAVRRFAIDNEWFSDKEIITL